MAESKEDRERWESALEAIDDALESDDLGERLQGAFAWALMDMADSLDVVSQHFENAGAKPQSRSRKPPKKKGKVAAEVEEEEEEEEEEERD